jgi:sodium/potassium-transporting ATPase subunit alpha
MPSSLVIAIFVTQEPGIQHIFGTTAMPLGFWIMPLLLALGILVIHEARKAVVRGWPGEWVARVAW